MSDLYRVSRAISSIITKWKPVTTRVTRVHGDGTLEMSATRAPMDHTTFWPKQVHFDKEQRERNFIQFHRSVNGYETALGFALALKHLCDEGVRLLYEGNPIVDIWVMKALEFDVSDLISSRTFTLREARSRATLSCLGTYKTMDELRKLGPETCKAFGFSLPEESARGTLLKTERPRSYENKMPHRWIAVVVEDSKSGSVKRKLLHLDLCGLAFDDRNYATYRGELVSFYSFITKEFDLVPVSDRRHTPNKFELRARRKISEGSKVAGTAIVSDSVRHFRCYHDTKFECLEVTTLDVFAERKEHLRSCSYDKLIEMVNALRAELMHRLAPGCDVVLQKSHRAEVNGSMGQIQKSSEYDSSRDLSKVRIKVQVEEGDVFLIRPFCIRLPGAERQYSRRAGLVEQVKAQRQQVLMDVKSAKSTDEALKEALNRDPNVDMVHQAIANRQIQITSFAADEFVDGMQKLLAPRLSKTLQQEQKRQCEAALSIANSPKGKKAIELLREMNEQWKKTRNGPSGASDAGKVWWNGSSYHRYVDEVAKKIRTDKELVELFERIERNGLGMNPIAVMKQYPLIKYPHVTYPPPK